MTKLDSLKFNLWDSDGTLADLISRWVPKKCSTEKEYEKSLLNFLNKEIPDIKIIPQYAIGRSKADLLIGNDIILEIKKDLTKTTQYDRLIGQLTRYQEWKGRVIVLLVGEVDNNLKKGIEKFINNSSFLFFKKNSVIVK